MCVCVVRVSVCLRECESVNVSYSDFSSGDFSDSKIQGSFIANAKLQNANFENCDCEAMSVTFTFKDEPELAELPIEQIRERISQFPIFVIVDVSVIGNDTRVVTIEFNNFISSYLSNADLSN